MIPDVVQQRRLAVKDLLTQRTLPLLAQQYLTIHVDQRLFEFKRRGNLRTTDKRDEKTLFPARKIASLRFVMNEKGNINKALFPLSMNHMPTCRLRLIDVKSFSLSKAGGLRNFYFPSRPEATKTIEDGEGGEATKKSL